MLLSQYKWFRNFTSNLLTFTRGEGNLRVGQIVRDTCPLLLYVPDDGQRGRRWSKRQTECSGRVYGNQVVARRQGQGLSSVEQKRHRWDTNAGSRGEIVTGVEQGEAARRWQVLGELHERVSERVVGLSLQSSHSGAAIYDDSSFSTPVDLEDGGESGPPPSPIKPAAPTNKPSLSSDLSVPDTASWSLVLMALTRAESRASRESIKALGGAVISNA
ncbi:unnamed protein product, partial [Vitis vinifera]